MTKLFVFASVALASATSLALTGADLRKCAGYADVERSAFKLGKSYYVFSGNDVFEIKSSSPSGYFSLSGPSPKAACYQTLGDDSSVIPTIEARAGAYFDQEGKKVACPRASSVSKLSGADLNRAASAVLSGLFTTVDGLNDVDGEAIEMQKGDARLAKRRFEACSSLEDLQNPAKDTMAKLKAKVSVLETTYKLGASGSKSETSAKRSGGRH